MSEIRTAGAVWTDATVSNDLGTDDKLGADGSRRGTGRTDLGPFTADRCARLGFMPEIQTSGHQLQTPVRTDPTVDPGTVTVSIDGKRVSLPWKPEGDTAEGFAGFLFGGLGYAMLEKPSITVR
jgi:hypothetical protein